MGKSWSRPEKFSDLGTLPRLVNLPCGTTLICYARPGTFVQASLDDGGTAWSEPLEVMTPADRSTLGNIPADHPVTFHEWVGSCNNPELLAIGDNSAFDILQRLLLSRRYRSETQNHTLPPNQGGN